MEGPGETIRGWKDRIPGVIPISRGDRSLGCLRPFGGEAAADRSALERLARWHAAAFAGVGPTPVTAEGVRNWLCDRVLRNPIRALFWVCNPYGEPVGHLGLSRAGSQGDGAEVIDRVAGQGGDLLVAAAADALRGWLRGPNDQVGRGQPGRP